MINIKLLMLGGDLRGVMVKSINCGIVSKFELQLCYYIHFWTNPLGKVRNLFIVPAMG